MKYARASAFGNEREIVVIGLRFAKKATSQMAKA